mmetsp:Transcript_9116/g.12604  ORF Transcript_9116/g.12604 Transcript_9116/m.12604 type:complete len:429 (-) Transcript_9116:150-1436(-)
MSCNLFVENFSIPGLHDSATGMCRTINCQRGSVGSHPHQPPPALVQGISQGQFSELMASNEEIKKSNDEIKSMVAPKVQCMSASNASSNDLHEMFDVNELDAQYIIENYDRFGEEVLHSIYTDLKAHTEKVIEVTAKNGDEMSEIRDIQTLSFALLQKITAHIFPSESYDLKRNGFFKTSEVVSESSDRVVKFSGFYDEMVTLKGTTFTVLALLEDKNPKSKKIPKKSIAQGVIQVCAMHRALLSINCSPQHLFTLIHNGLEWIIVLRMINLRGDESYLYTQPVECTTYDKNTKLTTISEEGLQKVSRLLYVVLQTTLATLVAVKDRLEHMFLTNQSLQISEFDKDLDDEDEEDLDGDDAGGVDDLPGSLKLASTRGSQRQRQKPTTAGKRTSTAADGAKKKSTYAYSRPVEFLQLTAKNLILAPAMC